MAPSISAKPKYLIDLESGITEEDVAGMAEFQHDRMLEEGWGDRRCTVEHEVMSASDAEVERRYRKAVGEKADEKAFFSSMASEEDFELWNALDLWSLDEGVALSIGLKPRQGFLFWAARNSELTDAREAIRRAGVFARRDYAGRRDNWIHRADFVAWLESAQLSFPSALKHMAQPVSHLLMRLAEVADDETK